MKKNRSIKSFLVVILLFFCSNCYSQLPTYTCEIVQYKQLNYYELEFVIQIFKTNTVYLEISSQTYGIYVNPLLSNAGTITASVIPGFSDLVASQQAISIQYNSSSNQIRLAAPTTTTSGLGTIINTSAKVCKVKLTNTVPFATVNPNFTWGFTASPTTSASALRAFVSNISTDITNQSFFLNPSLPIIAIPTIQNISVNSGIGALKCRAGIGELLTITGIDFGPSPGALGKVYFKNVNQSASLLELELESIDIISWSNTQIVVKIPSIIIIGATAYFPGQGSIRIRTSSDILSDPSSNLEIIQSFRNLYLSPTAKDRVYLNRTNCVNGITFRVSPDIAVNNTMLSTIERALANWSIELGIELKVERNVGVLVTSSNGTNSNDGINTIYTASYTTSATAVPYLMKTNAGSATIDICNNKQYREDTDIEIVTDGSYVIIGTGTSTFNWSYSPKGDLPASKYDFFADILHELGHAIGLEHVNYITANPESELMYIGDLPGPLLAVNRTNLYSGSAYSKAAGIIQSNDGKAQTWSCTGLNPLFTIPIITIPPGVSHLLESQLCGVTSIQLQSNFTTGNTWSTGAASQSISVVVPGSYTVSKSINGCTSTSAPVVVTKNAVTGITHPTAKTSCTGASTTFTCSTTSLAPTYQWQKAISGSTVYNNVVDGTNYGGTQTSTLNVTNIPFAFNNQKFRCLISTYDACSATNAAILTVNNVAFGRLPSQYSNVTSYTLTQGSPTPATYSGTSIISGNNFRPNIAGVGIHTISYSPSCGGTMVSQPIIVVPCCNPTTTTNEMPPSICIIGSANTTFTIYCTLLGSYNTGNVFQAQLSNSTGSFTSPTIIGTTTSTSSTSISCTAPSTIPAGGGYQIRISATNPNPAGSLNIYNTKPIIIYKVPAGQPCNQQRLSDEISVSSSSFKIYPNPAKNSITIKFNEIFSGKIVISDIQGRNIDNYEVIGNQEYWIDVSHYARGLLFVTGINEEYMNIQKFIKN